MSGMSWFSRARSRTVYVEKSSFECQVCLVTDSLGLELYLWNNQVCFAFGWLSQALHVWNIHHLNIRYVLYFIGCFGAATV